MRGDRNSKEARQKRGGRIRKECVQFAWRKKKKTPLLLIFSLFLPLFLSLPPQTGKFTTVKDAQDGYEFAYPFGWQEVT